MAPQAAVIRQLAESQEGRTGSLRLLVDGSRDLPARQRTLRDATSWSYALLDEAERQLFRRLAAFVGGCTNEAAEIVCAARLETIGSLVEKSLVRQEMLDDEEPRLRMLETIRERERARGERAGPRNGHPAAADPREGVTGGEHSGQTDG